MAYIEAWVDGQDKCISVNTHPEHCPHCNHVVHAEVLTVSFYNHRSHGKCMEVVFRCPHPDCSRLYIATYRETTVNNYGLVKVMPIPSSQKQFEERISKVSPDFCKIWNQAATAEAAHLDEICGLGYRKALEFLAKDYLLIRQPGNEAEIKQKPLGYCIENMIDNPRIKACAKRATWLGNDEAHYERKWQSKDIGDLKTLIELTVNWINMEYLTESYEQSMGTGK